MAIDLIALLPREVSTGVFSYFDPQTLAKCDGISKVWQNVARDDNLWKSLHKQYEIRDRNKDTRSWKEKVIAWKKGERNVLNKTGLLAQMKGFLSTQQEGTVRAFRYNDPKHPDHQMTFIQSIPNGEGQHRHGFGNVRLEQLEGKISELFNQADEKRTFTPINPLRLKKENRIITSICESSYKSNSSIYQFGITNIEQASKDIRRIQGSKSSQDYWSKLQNAARERLNPPKKRRKHNPL